MPDGTRIDKGLLTAVTTAVTLAECLVVPYRHKLVDRQQHIKNRLVYGHQMRFVPITYEAANNAIWCRVDDRLRFAAHQ